jgi:hypothetical protein
VPNDSTLFINNTEGSPDTIGKAVTVSAYDNQTSADIEFPITGWSSITPAVRQAEFPTEPIHLFVNEILFDQN